MCAYRTVPGSATVLYRTYKFDPFFFSKPNCRSEKGCRTTTGRLSRTRPTGRRWSSTRRAAAGASARQPRLLGANTGRSRTRGRARDAVARSSGRRRTLQAPGAPGMLVPVVLYTLPRVLGVLLRMRPPRTTAARARSAPSAKSTTRGVPQYHHHQNLSPKTAGIAVPRTLVAEPQVLRRAPNCTVTNNLLSQNDNSPPPPPPPPPPRRQRSAWRTTARVG